MGGCGRVPSPQICELLSVLCDIWVSPSQGLPEGLYTSSHWLVVGQAGSLAGSAAKGFKGSRDLGLAGQLFSHLFHEILCSYSMHCDPGCPFPSPVPCGPGLAETELYNLSP